MYERISQRMNRQAGVASQVGAVNQGAAKKQRTVRSVQWPVVIGIALGATPAGVQAQQPTGGGQPVVSGTSTQPSFVPSTSGVSAAPGTVPGGVQPPLPGAPSAQNVAATPSSVQLGPVQGLGGGIRPPRLLPTAGAPLSLDEAIRVSLANNLNIFTAASQDKKAKKRVRETQTGFLPRFGATANYTYTGNVATVNLGGPTGQSIALGTHRNYGADVSVTEPIDTSGSLSATLGIARAQQDAQDWALDSARRQVILSTASAFLQVLRSQGQLSVANEELRDSQAHVDLAQKYLRAGTIARYDLLTAQTSLSSIQQQFFSARTNYNDAVAGLNNAMGISQETVIQPANPRDPGTTIPQFAPSLAAALKNRPELRQIDANVQTALQSARLAASGTLPTLGVQANYVYNGVVSGFGGLKSNWTLGLVGSWDPFDWGATQQRRGQALEDAQTTRYLRLQAEQGIEYQVRQSINQIADALDRRAAAEAAVVQAREQLRLANLRYQTGAGTNTEVVDAEASLAQASLNASNALYDQYAADANYQRATGTEPLAATPLTK